MGSCQKEFVSLNQYFLTGKKKSQSFLLNIWVDQESLVERLCPSLVIQHGSKKYMAANWPNGRSPSTAVCNRVNHF